MVPAVKGSEARPLLGGGRALELEGARDDDGAAADVARKRLRVNRRRGAFGTGTGRRRLATAMMMRKKAHHHRRDQRRVQKGSHGRPGPGIDFIETRAGFVELVVALDLPADSVEVRDGAGCHVGNEVGQVEAIVVFGRRNADEPALDSCRPTVTRASMTFPSRSSVSSLSRRSRSVPFAKVAVRVPRVTD